MFKPLSIIIANKIAWNKNLWQLWMVQKVSYFELENSEDEEVVTIGIFSFLLCWGSKTLNVTLNT